MQDIDPGLIPIDQYGPTDWNRVPEKEKAAFLFLHDAAMEAGEMFVIERGLMREVEGDMHTLRKHDLRADDPYCFPMEDGSFVPYWEHPKLTPFLKNVKSQVTKAMLRAKKSGAESLHEYTKVIRREVRVSKGEDSLREMAVAYVQYTPALTFNFVHEEVVAGKYMVQGYLGIKNEGETAEIQEYVRKLEKARAMQLDPQLFAKVTYMSVDDPVIMAGYLSKEAHRDPDAIDAPEPNTLSAQNLPNRPDFSREGKRTTVFTLSFNSVIAKLLRVAGEYSVVRPNRSGILRALIGHEYMHSFMPENIVEILLKSPYATEAFPDPMHLVLAAEILDIEKDPRLWQEAVDGWLAYALRDHMLVEKLKSIPTVGELSDIDIHLPGSLVGLRLGVDAGGLRIRDGKIVDVNYQAMSDMLKKWGKEQQDLLLEGNIEKIRDYTQERLPVLPMLGRKNGEGIKLGPLRIFLR